MNNYQCHKRLVDTVVRLQPDILQQLLPDTASTAPAAVNVRPLPYNCIHTVAMVEMGRNGSSIRFFAKSGVNYSGPQSLETEDFVLRCIAPEIWKENPRTRCPQSLAFFPEHKLLLQELVEGKPLKELLFDAGPMHSNIPELLALSGEWLGRFHALTQGELGSPFEWLESCFGEESIGDVFHRCGVSNVYREVRQLLRQFGLAYPDYRRPLCRLHGEFTPLHILVKGDAIHVVDFGSSRLGFAYEDIASFTTFFDTLLPWRAVVGSLRLPLVLQKGIFRESYLAHCQQTFGPPDNIVMRFANLRAMAQQESCWERIPKPRLQALHFKVRRSWLRNRFAAVARREFEYLKQAVETPPVWRLDCTSPPLSHVP